MALVRAVQDVDPAGTLVTWPELVAAELERRLTRRLNAHVATEVAHGIRHLREHRGLTQQGLAERMGVTQSLVSRWEDPQYRGWTLKTLLKIGFALQARLRVRLDDPEEP